jgi:hypothetical protein
VKTEPSTPNPNPTETAGMEVDSEGPTEGSVETGKVKTWQLKKRMPGCKYDITLPKFLIL